LREVEKVWAIGEKIQNPVYDHFIIMLTNSSQTIGVIEISWLAQKEEEKFEFIDTNGRKIEIINYNFFLEDSGKREKNLLEGFFKDQKRIIKKWTKFFLTNLSKRKIKDCIPQHILLTEFFKSIRNDTDPPVTPEEGRRTVRLLEYIEESLTKNEPVNVNKDL
jgi:predicted dehydrogenase